jgi:hypothetical protein
LIAATYPQQLASCRVEMTVQDDLVDVKQLVG